MTKEVIQLTDELHAVGEKLDQVLARMDVEYGRARWHRVGTLVLAAVVVAVSWLGVRDAQERDRANQRACVAANETRSDIRGSIVETVLVIVERTENPERLTPLIAEIQDRLAVTIPDRPCD